MNIETSTRSGERSVNDFKKLILTNEEYLVHPFARGEARTYEYELSGGGKALRYIGAYHTNTPEEPIFGRIKGELERYRPDLVYVEGMGGFMQEPRAEQLAHVLELSPDAAAREGEPMFTAKLALESGIDLESPELDDAEEVRRLHERRFSLEDIFDFYVLRQAAQYQREHKTMDEAQARQHLERFITRLGRCGAWTPESLEENRKKFFKRFDISSDRIPPMVDPIPWDGQPFGVSNRIADTLSTIRDEYGLERIAEGLKTHRRLLAVYGSAHAVRLEPALRALFAGLEAGDN